MPPEIMHANKKLSTVEEHSNAIVLHFDDGSTAETDALIGADGLFGCVRSHVLGANHPAVKPVAAGWAGARNLVSYDKASSKLGSELFEEDRQYGWIGEGGFFMHDVLNDGKMVQCVGTSIDRDRNPSSERRRSIDRQYLEDAFSKWLDGPVAGNMIDVCPSHESSCHLTLTQLLFQASARARKSRRLRAVGTPRRSFLRQRKRMRRR